MLIKATPIVKGMKIVATQGVMYVWEAGAASARRCGAQRHAHVESRLSRGYFVMDAHMDRGRPEIETVIIQFLAGSSISTTYLAGS